MTSLGEQLRAAREARGLTLEQAERQTRIRARHLAALEAEDLTGFASPAAVPALDKARAKAAPRGLPAPSRAAPVVSGGWRRIFTRDLLIGVVFTALFSLLLGWGAWQLWQSTTAPTATPTAPAQTPTPPLDGTPLAAAPTPTATPPAPTPTEPLPTARPNYVGVNILVRAEQRLWLRAVVDGAETYVGQLAPGDAREFVGNSVVELWTGNGRGTRVVFNGQDQGTLGGLDEVVIRLWTLAGPLTPTPTPAP